MRLQYNTDAYHRTIVCDFDDTLSITNTKDWKNSTPNYSLIEKLNKLYDEGWQIIILTARGQLSCSADVDAATAKYDEDIKFWLSKHGVKYNVLSFNKYLGAYYVDDKSITPEDFIELDIETLKQGWSGATVERRGDKVYKTHKDSINAALWYKTASAVINVPVVHTIIGDTLCMEYLKTNNKNFKIQEIVDMLTIFSSYKNNYVPFDNYIDRIKKHCEFNNKFDFILPHMNEMCSFMDSCCSFMHGDLSVSNIINTDNGLYLIDPIYEPESYSSYLLDYAKLLCSYYMNGRIFEYDILYNTLYAKLAYEYKSPFEYVPIYRYIDILIISQFIRIYKYAPTQDIKDAIEKNINELYNDIEDDCKHIRTN